MSYILNQYDNHLAYFDIYYDIEGFRVENFKIVESNKHLLPLNLKQDIAKKAQDISCFFTLTIKTFFLTM